MLISFVFFSYFVCLGFRIILKLLEVSPNEEYWNLTFSSTFWLYPKSSPVKYSYFSNSPLDNTDILAASLSKSY